MQGHFISCRHQDLPLREIQRPLSGKNLEYPAAIVSPRGRCPRHRDWPPMMMETLGTREQSAPTFPFPTPSDA